MRKYLSTLPAFELQSTLTAGSDTLVITDFGNLVPAITSGTDTITLVVEPDTENEEIVTVTAHASGSNTFTVVRAQEGTDDITHTAGVAVKHMVTARDLQEPHQHINASNYADNGSVELHGLGTSDGDVVGTAKAQTLTNKVISGLTNDINNIAQTDVTGLVADLASKASATHSHVPSDITGVTATVAELNILDGATVTFSELNVLDGISTASPLQTVLDAKLNEPTSTGIVVRTGDNTVAARTLGYASGITISNANGVSAAPTISLASTAVLTTGITASSGWTILEQSYKQSGNTVQVNVKVERTGSITVPTDGNIAPNIDVCTMPSGFYPVIQAPVVSGATGRIASGYISTSGVLTLAAVSGGANIATGDQFSFNSTYIL